MRVLIVHHEAEYFAGAEKMLGYFLQGLATTPHSITVAAVRESRIPEILPPGIRTVWLPSNARFSVTGFRRQVQALRQAVRAEGFDLLHGWAARDWELTAAAARLTGRPALGTLHDHPKAAFLSKPRRSLMRWSAALGLAKVVCVSEAVRAACAEAGYAGRKLVVAHNGLPAAPAIATPTSRSPQPFHLGFLGLFSARKGVRGLFEILDQLSAPGDLPWRLSLAGDAQEEEGRKLVAEIKATFSTRPWWSRVQWCGWVKRPADFLGALDLLVCPSAEFDPFPTVLLEAGQAGVPVLAARVGGVPEIVVDGETGWLFAPQDWGQAARQLRQVLESPALARATGERAKKRVEREFAMGRMVADYLNVYTDLSPT
jgi:glycosyltransferase involved in cell wall biosynthesis